MRLNSFILCIRRASNFIDKLSNRVKFSAYGVKYGKNLCVHGMVGLSVGNKSSFTIGDNFYFSSGKHINPLCSNKQGGLHVNSGALLTIGNNVGMSSTVIWCHKSIAIGTNVKVGANSYILDSDCHSINFEHRRTLSIDKHHKHDAPIVIEDDVLIGMNCMILKGVTIGARSIIGAGSVVTKSIPADCIAAGNPAKVIKQLKIEKNESILF